MNKEYLEQVKESAFKGIMRLGKSTFLYHTVVTLIFSLLSFVLVMVVLGPDFYETLAELQNNRSGGDPQEVFANMSSFFSSFAALLPFTMLLGAIQYTLSLNINNASVLEGKPDINQTIKQTFGRKLLHIIGYSLLVWVLIAVAGGVLALIIAGIGAASKILMALAIFILLVLFILYIIRTIAGYAFVVHGDQTAIEALKSSFRTITMVRALIILVIGIAIGICLMLIQLGLTPLIAAITDNAMVQNQLNTVLISLLIYPFIIAAISSLYFRYNQPEEPEASVEEHLITD